MLAAALEIEPHRPEGSLDRLKVPTGEGGVSSGMSVHPFVMVGQTPGRSTVAGVTSHVPAGTESGSGGRGLSASCPRTVRETPIFRRISTNPKR